MNTNHKKEPSTLASGGERLDRKLGMLWSRLWALIIGTAGVALLAWFFTAAEDKSTGGIVFIVMIGGLLLLLARYLWRSKDGIVETLDAPDKPSRRH